MHFDLAAIPQSDAYSPSAGDPDCVATDKMRPVGHMHGCGWYARTSDVFPMEQISLAGWKAEEKDDKQ